MSYAPQGSGAYVGEAPQRKGSVKAARERANAEQQYLRPDNFSFPAQSHELSSQYSRPPTRPQVDPTPPSSSEGNRQMQPSPGPDWPLPAPVENDAPRQKGPPPQRPPRPSYVPSILDPSNQSQFLAPPMPATPRRHHNPEPVSPSEYADDNLLSPSYYPSARDNRPMTTLSFASNSSLGEIPDFPVPVDPVQPRATLGPPPTARRGPSSYYSQMSYVSPIVEEAESSRSHNSFASSNVIPSSVPDFYLDEYGNPSYDDIPMNSPSDDGRFSHDGDEKGLVRHASVGKRVTPALTNVKSVDSFEKLGRESKKRSSLLGAAGGVFGGGYGASREGQPRSSSRPDSEALSGAWPGQSSSPTPSPTLSTDTLNFFTKKPSKPSPLARSDSLDSPVDPRVEQILGGLEKGGALGPEGTKSSSLADRVGSRRPPRLNINSVRDAEARGSLTSLPDLIKRATRLATNLDRGKTASRVGVEMWEKGGDQGGHARNSGSIHDMLSSFPPPGLGTPNGSAHGSRPPSRWPSGLALHESHYPDENDTRREPRKQGRKCCGMPLWCFVTLITVLAVLVIAAIVVPICLIVVPAQDSKSSGLASCQKNMPCKNGGSSIIDLNGQCSCLCTNGFTGTQCTLTHDASCTTSNIGSIRNATIGSAIPDLLSDGKSEFDIPLNSTLIYTLFTTSNMSCTAQNALVTLNGLSARSVEPMPNLAEEAVPSATFSSAPAAMTTAPPSLQLAAREVSSEGAKTKLGIVYDASPASSTATATATDAAASASSSASLNSVGVSSKELHFSRIVVLYVFQASRDLTQADMAQQNLQTYFFDLKKGNKDAIGATAVSLGNGFTIDFTQWHVTLKNGTAIGKYVS
ncbi:uncharacterized protein K452DRAFT_294837 [Aplosporella prunicola CBS 121167]|uniref:EGF-like domain-containing protein n=1 Tax=Aplosporella prunicola CBS 121167 TaxID=1176127 RepID=A0A6A6BTV3_9PEZI|nr:uncharacterized protein K452DRAFT_294837 [Aplosporella prunicola CBS 121167]KAF2146257.1 hypothetical protein K452DRAFT_294837 [Aplosporella prunicola CBS 121167]